MKRTVGIRQALRIESYLLSHFAPPRLLRVGNQPLDDYLETSSISISRTSCGSSQDDGEDLTITLEHHTSTRFLRP